MYIHTRTGAAAVRAVLKEVMRGRVVDGRGGRTRELAAAQVRVDLPSATLVEHAAHFRPALAAAEALHLISGQPYGPRIQAITENYGSHRWAPGRPSFGVSLRDQMPAILWKLERTPATRQAVGLVWDRDTLGSGDEDYLCATSVQFLVRDGGLEAIVNWRSQDAWYGLPYNLFQWGQLVCTLATCLGLHAGTLTFNVGSLHLYERHWGRALRSRPEIRAGQEVYGVGTGGSDPQHAWLSAVARASALLAGRVPHGATPDEETLAALLAP